MAQEGGNEIVLAKVVLGNVKDYLAKLAPELLREPIDERTGIAYDSWTGTEDDLRGVTEIEAVRLSGSPTEKEKAQLLVDEGHKYGRQYIVCRYQKAYPAYVVRYEVLQDAALSERRPLESGDRSVDGQQQESDRVDSDGAMFGAPPTAPAVVKQHTFEAPQLGALSGDAGPYPARSETSEHQVVTMYSELRVS